MEEFKEGLIKSKELVRKCKNREILKKHIITLSCIGKLSEFYRFKKAKEQFIKDSFK